MEGIGWQHAILDCGLSYLDPKKCTVLLQGKFAQEVTKKEGKGNAKVCSGVICS